ncbi:MULTISPECIES: hypothetical protein [unclassified Streptomyces]|uniref:hypothetical protein n=1 Tax=unclassified Streptomyces TaxID=2593676 RepID=UPI0006ADC870|nr:MULTISPECIES: hypothetical protein [unclassified Streptomyces]KOX21669.1 hypothetical protein ADL06_25185 [Streptomyces sp. NRRL F-6491]KOX42271.1 hypothetical protein ADL08_16200 [Streptomyces sp. NRRL F-6492]
MTEQLTTTTGPAPVQEPPAPAPAREPAAPGRARRVLWAVARWTAAVVVCGGVGAGTATGITALDRTDVPGLATENDGRWEYPRLRLPALPADRPRPFTEGNEAEIHYADVRQLLLPAPAGATVDPELNGGWVPEDTYLAGYGKEDRARVERVLDDVALRHITGRAWTMPDGTRTRVLLLRFSSVAHADHLDSSLTGDGDEALPAGVGGAEILDRVAGDVRVPDVTAYAYKEKAPYGPEETLWAHVRAGDTLAVVTQTRKGGALTVPFQQTLVLQAQLLG